MQFACLFIYGSAEVVFSVNLPSSTTTIARHPIKQGTSFT